MQLERGSLARARGFKNRDKHHDTQGGLSLEAADKSPPRARPRRPGGTSLRPAPGPAAPGPAAAAGAAAVAVVVGAARLPGAPPPRPRPAPSTRPREKSRPIVRGRAIVDGAEPHGGRGPVEGAVFDTITCSEAAAGLDADGGHDARRQTPRARRPARPAPRPAT